MRAGIFLQTSLLLVALFATAALAQPQLPAPIDAGDITAGAAKTGVAAARDADMLEVQQAAADRQPFTVLRQQGAQAEKTNPQLAIGVYQKFLDDHKALHPMVQVEVDAEIGQLYQIGLKDNAHALAAYQAGYQIFSGTPWRGMVMRNMAGSARPLLQGYVKVLSAGGQKDLAIKVLQDSLLGCPSMLDEDAQGSDGWMYSSLIDLLLAAKKPDEALRWAKLRFALCPYSKTRLALATKELARVWTAIDPSGKTLQQFIAAQKDASLPNPLSLVKMPDSVPATVAGQIILCGADHGGAHDRISLAILSGDWPGGMDTARTMTAGLSPKEQEARGTEPIMEACRLLKAGDGNLLSANALLGFLRTHQGDNPVIAFLKRHPGEQTKVAVVAVVTKP